MKLSKWQQLKVRSDLVVSPQSQQGQLFYVIKDPITLRYFRLRSTEHAIFKMLDGSTSVDDIKKRLAVLGHDISDEELQTFLTQLGAANFYENVLPNQAESLYQMATLRRKRKSVWTQVKRILFIKIPMVDPDRFFTKVMPYIDFLWSRWAMLAYAALLAFSLWAFFDKYEEARLGFSGLLTAESLALFWVIFIVEKFFHELGHGFTCKHFGGEVHEMGALVLVLTPCMYCNISDAWIIEKHSRKLYISAAGIVTEIVIACVSAIVWWASAPGVVNNIAYRVMLLAGVSSILINGNPLMKWDGYYILSDFLGMPNLRANSMAYLAQFFKRYALGFSIPGMQRFNREALIKIIYGILSTAWIAYVMYRITRGMLIRFPAIGVWVLVTTLYGLIFIPIVRLTKFFAARRGKAVDVDIQRLAIIAALVVMGGYFLFFYDMGYSVTAPCVIEPRETAVLKAPAGGVLVEMNLSQGDPVTEGQTVARLQNTEMEVELRSMCAQVEAYEVQMDSARSMGLSTQLDNLARSRDEISKRIEQTRERLDSLVLTAPISGIVLTDQPGRQLGKYLLTGDPVLEIGSLDTAKVTIAVEQEALKYVRTDADVSITLRAYPWRSFTGTVSSISGAPVTTLSNPALSHRSGGNIATRPDTAAYVPIMPTYEVNILLPNEDCRFLVGMVGKARIDSERRRPYDVIFTRIRETLRRTFGLFG